MTLDQSKEIVRSFYAEAINGRDAYACERWLSKGFVHNGVKRGAQGQREVVSYFLAAFQPLRHEILLLLAEEDLVAAHQRWSGRHVGEFLQCPASNREVSFTSTAILRIAKGEIVQAWDEMDSGAIVAQLSGPASG
ncbi:MAG TPA: ester cyclase [Solirubrobacteraceae bacterium]|nr:ester cyclase [Solirubrobacteraceae bacterium]